MVGPASGGRGRVAPATPEREGAAAVMCSALNKSGTRDWIWAASLTCFRKRLAGDNNTPCGHTRGHVALRGTKYRLCDSTYDE
eukprot:6659044-Prymnesium_polylepis.2